MKQPDTPFGDSDKPRYRIYFSNGYTIVTPVKSYFPKKGNLMDITKSGEAIAFWTFDKKGNRV